MWRSTSLKYDAVPRRARIHGSYTFVSLNSRLESNKEGGKEEKKRRLEIWGLGSGIKRRRAVRALIQCVCCAKQAL